MMEIAGMMISGVSLLNDLWGRFKDLSTWTEADLPVDREFLALAVAQRKLQGAADDYVWCREASVPTKELKGTHSVVIAFHSDRRTKYRLYRGRGGDRLILMKKMPAGAVAA
jgi:hypothetical protein